jgi:NADH-quinone oxidoreductase subunit A
MESNAFSPLLIYAAAVIVLVMLLTGVSHYLGPHHRPGKQADAPFESGIVTVGEARLRFPVAFYLVAMFFVIFDVEAIYLFGWAIAVREAGWAGFIEVSIFVAVLLAALAYLWRMGALDWGPVKERRKGG